MNVGRLSQSGEARRQQGKESVDFEKKAFLATVSADSSFYYYVTDYGAKPRLYRLAHIASLLPLCL
jgi:hypothetical protein